MNLGYPEAQELVGELSVKTEQTMGCAPASWGSITCGPFWWHVLQIAAFLQAPG